MNGGGSEMMVLLLVPRVPSRRHYHHHPAVDALHSSGLRKEREGVVEEVEKQQAWDNAARQRGRRASATSGPLQLTSRTKTRRGLNIWHTKNHYIFYLKSGEMGIPLTNGEDFNDVQPL